MSHSEVKGSMKCDLQVGANKGLRQHWGRCSRSIMMERYVGGEQVCRRRMEKGPSGTTGTCILNKGQSYVCKEKGDY